MSLLPYRPEIAQSETEPVVMDLEDTPDSLFKALSSDTCRDILKTLYECPTPASHIADTVDTSLQNVQYHLNNLRESDLVTVVGTWYSEKGREMKVYGPTKEPVVLVVGETQASTPLVQYLTESARQVRQESAP